MRSRGSTEPTALGSPQGNLYKHNKTNKDKQNMACMQQSGILLLITADPNKMIQRVALHDENIKLPSR